MTGECALSMRETHCPVARLIDMGFWYLGYTNQRD